jgi:hypothetical protein
VAGQTCRGYSVLGHGVQPASEIAQARQQALVAVFL